MQEWRPGALVVGLPYNMDLSEQDMTHRARHFAEQLAERFPLPVHTVDERLSSREAEAALKERRQQGRRARDPRGHRRRSGLRDPGELVQLYQGTHRAHERHPVSTPEAACSTC